MNLQRDRSCVKSGATYMIRSTLDPSSWTQEGRSCSQSSTLLCTTTCILPSTADGSSATDAGAGASASSAIAFHKGAFSSVFSSMSGIAESSGEPFDQSSRVYRDQSWAPTYPGPWHRYHTPPRPSSPQRENAPRRPHARPKRAQTRPSPFPRRVRRSGSSGRRRTVPCLFGREDGRGRLARGRLRRCVRARGPGAAGGGRGARRRGRGPSPIFSVLRAQVPDGGSVGREESGREGRTRRVAYLVEIKTRLFDDPQGRLRLGTLPLRRRRRQPPLTKHPGLFARLVLIRRRFPPWRRRRGGHADALTPDGAYVLRDRLEGTLDGPSGRSREAEAPCLMWSCARGEGDGEWLVGVYRGIVRC